MRLTTRSEERRQVDNYRFTIIGLLTAIVFGIKEFGLGPNSQAIAIPILEQFVDLFPSLLLIWFLCYVLLVGFSSVASSKLSFVRPLANWCYSMGMLLTTMTLLIIMATLVPYYLTQQDFGLGITQEVANMLASLSWTAIMLIFIPLGFYVGFASQRVQY